MTAGPFTLAQSAPSPPGFSEQCAWPAMQEGEDFEFLLDETPDHEPAPCDEETSRRSTEPPEAAAEDGCDTSVHDLQVCPETLHPEEETDRGFRRLMHEYTCPQAPPQPAVATPKHPRLAAASPALAMHDPAKESWTGRQFHQCHLSHPSHPSHDGVLIPLSRSPAITLFEERSARPQHVGTGDAKQQSHMSTALKQNEIAAFAEKILPDAKGGIEVLPKPPVDAKEEARMLQFSSGERANLRAETAFARTATTEAGPPNRGAEAELLTKLSQTIAAEVRVMRQMRPDRLAIMFRPGGDTKIFLQFAIRHGQIEAFARCDRGDFNFFNAHWPELQHALQQQGVRLLELKEPVTYMFDQGAGKFPGHNHRQGREERDSSAFTQETRPKQVGTASRQTSRGRPCHLELWA